MDPFVGPGKCVPRFIEDLLRYDPASPASHGRNVLTDPPIKLEDGGVLPISVNPGACRHKFMLKTEQSVLPPSDWQPNSSSCFKVASFCSDCRWHVDITVDFRAAGSTRPCPNNDFPLHHLRYDPTASDPRPKPANWTDPRQWVDRHRFVCSAPECSVVVLVTYRPPRLQPEHLSLLVDPAQIRERAQREIDMAPERFKNTGVPEPIVVLQNLKQYLTDALRAKEVKQFPAANKRFLTSLGKPCRPLLEYLGFRYDAQGHAEYGGTWTLPRVHGSGSAPTYQDDQSVLVDDVDKELMVLIQDRPWVERSTAKMHVAFHPLPAMKSFERCLGSLDYRKTPSSRRIIDLTVEEDPYIVGLGAVANFADELVSYAYDRQRECDPEYASFYLGWLQEIAKSRPSEMLQTRVALLESAGEVSHTEVCRAYQYFQANVTWDDSFIIGAFRARVSDAPRQEAEARQYLHVLGNARQSKSIKTAASNNVTNYQEALAWLGAEESTSDEFIMALYTMKVDENRAEMGVGRDAVRLIAETRNSDALTNWLLTGQLGEVEMDVGEAYSRLGIEDRSLDDDMVLTTFDIRVSETPSQANELRAALKAIAKARRSTKMGWALRSGEEPQSTTMDWPVGLENIGNTCYLNSLLQFYFTVKPLRNLILNFHEVEMQVTAEGLLRKRVGSRKVSLKEIERAKKFVFELQKLFRSLISAQTSAITPERELARLTLIKSSDEDDYRRKSIASSHGRPSLGEINGMPVQGPSLPPQDTSMDIDTDMRGAQNPENGSSDESSEATLVEKRISSGGLDSEMRDAEMMGSLVGVNFEGTKDVTSDGVENVTEDKVMEDEEMHPPMHGNMEQADDVSISEASTLLKPDHQDDNEPADTTMTNDIQPAGSDAKNHPPERPPPVPPRPQPTGNVQRPVDELELGAQQDVTEVIGNVLFQLECAMRPTGIDSTGEQHDEIKQLFYGKLRGYIEGKGQARAKEEYFSDIKVDVASGPRDIYAALDGAFDAQDVTMKDGSFVQYTSIAHLPPILQIQVQRVQYDVENKKTYKSEAHLQLRETIHLDRYVDAKEPMLLRRRQETWKWKERLKQLEEKKRELLETEAGMDVAQVLELTRDWLEDVRLAGIEGIFLGDENISSFLTLKAEEARKELKDIDASMREIHEKLENQFNDLRQYAYRLAAVFIHRGTATFGHYWIYIYDFRRKIWRKYNDGYVTEVLDDKEIFDEDLPPPPPPSSSNTSGRSHYHPATPYFLVYVKEELKDELIDAVCREAPSLLTTDNNATTTTMKESTHDDDNNNNKAGHHDDEEMLEEEEVTEMMEMQERPHLDPSATTTAATTATTTTTTTMKKNQGVFWNASARYHDHHHPNDDDDVVVVDDADFHAHNPYVNQGYNADGW